MRLAFSFSCLFALAIVCCAQTTDTSSRISFVTSKDGTRIAVECIGKGPSLLIVHGGTGDRRRWQPLLPLFATRFTVCAMDRRGHGQSDRGSDYSLQKESEDVVAVANAQPAPVFVLGHSIGGVFALEAALMTNKISRLVLYEPPLQDLDHTEVADRMEKMIQAGDRERALVTFLREVVMVSPDEVAAMGVAVGSPQFGGQDLSLPGHDGVLVELQEDPFSPVLGRRYPGGASVSGELDQTRG